jgi:hypothetical protein
MTQDHNSEQRTSTAGQAPLRECPSFETLCLFFDEELEADDAARIRGHVAGCDACQVVLRDMRSIRQALVQTTPPPSRRTFRLTDADITGERPVKRPSERDTTTPMRRARILTLPILPALAAVAALLLLAVIAGDLLTGDNGDRLTTPPSGNPDVVLVDGTPFIVTDDDRSGNFGAASSENTNQDETNDSFWSLSRIGEVLLLAILVGLLASYLVQRRSHRT